MCFQFPQHDASTFPQVVCKAPKDKSACWARFLSPGPAECSDPRASGFGNLKEGAPELKVMQEI